MPGGSPRPPGYQGPQTFDEFLKSVKKDDEHGGPFAYKTVNSDALGWVIRRVTGKSVGENLSERIWSKLGMEQDAYFTADSVGNEFAGGGLNAGLRDLARFGEMMRNEDRAGGQQVIPKSVVDDIRTGGERAAFPAASYPLLPGWSYRNMGWVSNNARGAYTARGIHGQTIYIGPKAERGIRAERVRRCGWKHAQGQRGGSPPLTIVRRRVGLNCLRPISAPSIW